uniref:Uncharacterized protein n=1 Tax=Oryza meridionalis TaxID=40149 RepID=A0A0E0CYP9_9ORYZ
MPPPPPLRLAIAPLRSLPCLSSSSSLPRAPTATSLSFSRVGARARAAVPQRRRLPDPALAARRRRGARLGLGIHPSLRALNFVMRSVLRAAQLDLVFRLFSPDFPGDPATVAFLVRACSAEGRPLDGLRLQRVRSWAALGRTKEQLSDRSASMAAAAVRMSHSMALLGWSTPRRSWMS